MSAKGYPTREVNGHSPTGKSVTVTGFDLFRIEGGKITEMWQEADELGMLQQLSVHQKRRMAVQWPNWRKQRRIR